jgi:uncharacterized protein (TIGR00266 family)
MRVTEKGKTSFTHLEVKLEPGESLMAESGAMASCDSKIDVTTSLKGGLFSSIVRKLLGGESLFLNHYQNKSADRTQTLILSKVTPGDIVVKELHDDVFYLQPGSFLCATSGVHLKLKWAGFRFLFGGEGLFRWAATGSGKLWIGVYGALVKHELKGEWIVDTGHLVAYPEGVTYKIQLSSGLFSSFFSGEGLVGRLEGTGTVYLQTRSLNGFVSWLNPRLPN